LAKGHGERITTIAAAMATSSAARRISLRDDGSLTAEFQLTDTQEIKRWIMSFGPSATVLEPVELAEEIRHNLTQMLDAYAESLT
jgi:predicted DNA-binding transcriptional regulator YafY